MKLSTSEADLPDGFQYLQFDNKLIINRSLAPAQKAAIIKKLQQFENDDKGME